MELISLFYGLMLKNRISNSFDCHQKSQNGSMRELGITNHSNTFKSLIFFFIIDMANPDLIRFILEARRRGFKDKKIKESLLSNNWPASEVEPSFEAIKEKPHFKNGITIWLDSEVTAKLEKRAKKNMFTIQEQIEDIVRRSIINQKHILNKEKLDDMLVGLFSRKTRKK